MTRLFYVPKANQIFWLQDWEQRVSEMFKLIRLVCVIKEEDKTTCKEDGSGALDMSSL